VILTSRKDLISSYFFVLVPLSQGLPILPDIFLRKGIMEPALSCIFIAPQLDYASKYLIRVWGWGYMKEDLVFDKELFSCRIFGISKLFQTQKSFWHRFKANSFWRNSSDSYKEVFRSDENSLFCFWWNCEVMFDWSKKWFKIQFEGYTEPIFKAFILFAWIMIWFAWESTAYRSRLLAFDQKGLIRRVM